MIFIIYPSLTYKLKNIINNFYWNLKIEIIIMISIINDYNIYYYYIYNENKR